MSAAPHLSQSPTPAPRQRARLAGIAVLLGCAMLAACTRSAPPPVAVAIPLPPPPVVEAVPYRPLPPGGAHYVMELPARGADGRRITVNSNLSDDQLVWNLRSAWNVAALNCLAPEHDPILQGYQTLLTLYVARLKTINERIEKNYNGAYKARRDAMVARDGYTTQVYNFFALPPVRAGFCRAALEMSNRLLAAPQTDLLAFARANFDGVLVPFEEFFAEYEAYQRASAEWDAKWGAMYGPSQPGWVVVQEARVNGIPVPELAVQTVIDPETGVAVPVIPVNQDVISQPVVQPIAPATGTAPGK